MSKYVHNLGEEVLEASTKRTAIRDDSLKMQNLAYGVKLLVDENQERE